MAATSALIETRIIAPVYHGNLLHPPVSERA